MIRTAKAYAAAAMVALGAVLVELTPFLDGAAAKWAYAVLAVLAALGVTWRVPNAAPDHAGDHAGVPAILDALPALVGGVLGGRERAEPDPED
jgi:hypothetical protein